MEADVVARPIRSVAGHPLVRAPEQGWGSARTIGELATAAVVLAAFAVIALRATNSRGEPVTEPSGTHAAPGQVPRRNWPTSPGTP